MTSVAFFSMLAEGHMRRLLPLISGLSRRGVTAHVFTHDRFAGAVGDAGGTFVDLFGKYPLDAADAGSFPMALRSVAFAGHYAGEILQDLAELRPDLIVYDTFAMIGRVAGRLLGLPYVNVCAGHNVEPGRYQRILAEDPRVIVSPACLSAVRMLRDRYGVSDASPFSYVAGLSPYLNVYGEPPEYLTAEERRHLGSVAFFGSLPSLEEIEARRRRTSSPCFEPGEGLLKIYISFGTVVWRSYAAAALAALEAISSAIARLPHARAVISLGGAELEPGRVRRLARPNVAVESFVDQWAILQEADVFVTHHGLNSTHEAVFHGVPMISYPFFWDQPSLAGRCAALGLAVPLGVTPRAAITGADFVAALDTVTADRDGFRARLAAARDFELKVMAGRDAVISRILALA